jgi:molybdate transport repressor ModE-like protein
VGNCAGHQRQFVQRNRHQRSGGKSGGKSSLTDYGKKIVEKFKTAEEYFMKFSEDEIF